MRCKKVQVEISALIDGETTEKMAQYISIHVEECVECDDFSQDLQKVQRFLRIEKDREASDEEDESDEVTDFLDDEVDE